jgi:hypothetical protein
MVVAIPQPGSPRRETRRGGRCCVGWSISRSLPFWLDVGTSGGETLESVALPCSDNSCEPMGAVTRGGPCPSGTPFRRGALLSHRGVLEIARLTIREWHTRFARSFPYLVSNWFAPSTARRYTQRKKQHRADGFGSASGERHAWPSLRQHVRLASASAHGAERSVRCGNLLAHLLIRPGGPAKSLRCSSSASWRHSSGCAPASNGAPWWGRLERGQAVIEAAIDY